MGFINIFLNSEAKINIKNNQLTFVNSEKSIDYPLEDINSVMVDNPNSVVSFATISKLAEYGILTYVCDNKHLPNGIIIPFYNHYQKHYLQLSLTDFAFRKQHFVGFHNLQKLTFLFHTQFWGLQHF